MHDYDMNMDMNTRQRLLELNSRKNLSTFDELDNRILLSQKFRQHGISAIKFEAAQLYLLSDIFVCVAVAVTVVFA